MPHANLNLRSFAYSQAAWTRIQRSKGNMTKKNKHQLTVRGDAVDTI